MDNFITHLYNYVDVHLKIYLSTAAQEEKNILHLRFLTTYRALLLSQLARITFNSLKILRSFYENQLILK